MAACRQLSNEEVRRIAEALSRRKHGQRNRALFLLGCCLGARISSLLSLRVGDVLGPTGEVANQIVFQRRNVKRRHRSHIIELCEYARVVLDDYVSFLVEQCAADDDFPLFPAGYGSEPISRITAYRIIRNAARRCGFGGVIGTHSMRKTFACNYYNIVLESYRSGATNEDPLALTCGALNHADIRSTARYLPTKRDTINSFVKRISYAA